MKILLQTFTRCAVSLLTLGLGQQMALAYDHDNRGWYDEHHHRHPYIYHEHHRGYWDHDHHGVLVFINV